MGFIYATDFFVCKHTSHYGDTGHSRETSDIWIWKGRDYYTDASQAEDEAETWRTQLASYYKARVTRIDCGSMNPAILAPWIARNSITDPDESTREWTRADS